MVKRFKIPTDVSGHRGLLVAVVATAVKDATYGRGEWKSDARRYIASADYDRHIELLGLPPDALPRTIRGAIDE